MYGDNYYFFILAAMLKSLGLKTIPSEKEIIRHPRFLEANRDVYLRFKDKKKLDRAHFLFARLNSGK